MMIQPITVLLLAVVSIVLLLVFAMCISVQVKETLKSCDQNNTCMIDKSTVPKYEPEKWNSDINIQSAHNCYAYALNDQQIGLRDRCKGLLAKGEESCVSLRPKPGVFAGHENRDMTCGGLEKHILADNPYIKQGKRTDVCPPHHYKIAFAVKPGETYHFWRQDADGMWSHKDGGGPARDTDDSGKKITSPETADRGKYHKFCKYLCVPKNYHYKTNMKP